MKKNIQNSTRKRLLSPHIQRVSSIDVIKGVTALFMIFTHLVYFFCGFSNTALAIFVGFVDFTTFSLFFFFSGTGIYLSYLRPDISKEEFIKKKPK